MLVDQYLLAGRDQRGHAGRRPVETLHRLFLEAVDVPASRRGFRDVSDIAPRRFPAPDGIKSVVRAVEITPSRQNGLSSTATGDVLIVCCSSAVLC